jgi:CheY-like chemotaxis protein
MMDADRAALLGSLPFARRYARALTGSQQRGDALVATALRAMMAADLPPVAATLRVALYRAISDAAPPEEVRHEMGSLRRQILLLTALEEFSLPDAATVVRLPAEMVEQELRAARDMLRAGAVARVLIIEDEPIIALDIQELVERCGHSVVGIAATESEAVQIARRQPPTLVLADINLGAGGDGATAVMRILRDISVPVIFVTAYPERMLTGTVMEPAFVITKPFDPMTLAVATYQAVTRGVGAV